MYIIAGLGNPGGKYAHTRHNVGFDTIDKLAEKYQIRIDTRKFKGEYGLGYIEGQKVLLLKPLTYMNLSGECIQEVLSYFKADPEEELIVLFDDISLNPGLIRIRKKGSAGGHNGIKNIILHSGTQNFKRVKIGVGEKPKNWDLADYVLSVFPKADRELVEEAMEHAVDAVEMMLRDETDAAMNRYNRKSYETVEET
ncbi:MAG: aminoacyl-tRNA hydrolase [Lachnospiraceae bacterium]|nr:aminoacyl-tRNA hydrolase [Lachnospiraceae bacterium]MDD7024439.1 aminoacyl-tRNA hydrolase [Oscillospiraceae bacterium]MDY5540538.1 aminoacyl-tRNA hydrolase [Lachnospiraceae bacterium]